MPQLEHETIADQRDLSHDVGSVQILRRSSAARPRLEASAAAPAAAREPPPAPEGPEAPALAGIYDTRSTFFPPAGTVENGTKRARGRPVAEMKTCAVCGALYRVIASRAATSRTCGRAHTDELRKREGRPDGHSPAFKAKFAALWAIDPPLSRREIAHRLGLASTNAVAGLRSRMNLPKRPPKVKQGRRKRTSTSRPTNTDIAIRAARVKLASPQAPPIRVDAIPGTGCQWPVSETPWRICDAPRDRRHPYCAAHCRVAFQRAA